MRYIVVSLLVLAGCGGRGADQRVDPPNRRLGESIPFVAATTVEKATWLKKAGIQADPLLLGTSFRLDETTPYVPSHGDLTDINANDTSHDFGGFASLRTRLTMDVGTVTPGMIVHVKTDATHNQLFDCLIAAEGWQMEFQTADGWSWYGPPLTTATVTVQNNHAFFVLPMDATRPWAFVRIIATLQNPIDQYWRFVGCDIAPIN